MSTPTPVEERLRAALSREAAAADPEGDSLSTIRTRVRVARRRRTAVVAGLAVVAVLAGAIVVPRLGGDRDPVNTDTNIPATEPSTPGPAPSTTGATPSTAAPSAPATTLAAVTPMWPAAGGPTFDDPVAAARAFVQFAVGVPDAPLSAFHPDAGGATGTVDALAEGGVVSRLALRRDAAGHWSLLLATSPGVAIATPAPAERDTPPAPQVVHVTGPGAAGDGALTVEVLSPADPRPALAEATATAGDGQETGTWAADLRPAPSASERGILLVHADAGGATVVPAFAAQGLVLPQEPPTTPATPATTGAFRFQPLYPFADAAQVDEWRAAAAEGHQPWHLDPEATALSFAAWLGFGEIDTVTSRDVRGDEAWIGVGTHYDDGGDITAAVVHLARWGSGDDAPWEVAGTRDGLLTLETPHYGSAVSSPIAAGGHITGVDESLHVKVLQLTTEGPIGDTCCLPAGTGPWSTRVSYEGATQDHLVVVVSTGGHRQEVELFAVTGVRRR